MTILLSNAKRLRLNQTKAEQRLWYFLRAHRFRGIKFKRQKPLGPYIVDFVCTERRLIVELDGGHHALATARDRERDAWLRQRGYTVLRFWNNDVMCRTDAVLEVIGRALALSPNPSPRTGEGNRSQCSGALSLPSPVLGEGPGERALEKQKRRISVQSNAGQPQSSPALLFSRGESST